MNRRQRRAFAKKFPAYKKLLNEAKEKTFDQFKEMLEKRWAGTVGLDSQVSVTPHLNETIEEKTNKEPSSEAKNAEEEQNEAN